MSPRVCVYKASDVGNEMLPGLSIASRTETRADLLTAVQAFKPETVIIDLDEPDALDAIVQVAEIAPKAGIVCVAGNPDLERIIAAQRAGCQQITMRPIDPNDLASALRKVLNVAEEVVETNTTIAVFGAAGGVGATTIASHLALELGALSEGPTALFDFDLEFGGIARALDLDPQYTIADLANAGAADRFLLEKAAVSVSPDLHVFARPPELEDAHAVAETDVRAMLRAAKLAYRYIVTDLPRQLSAITGVAIEECHKLLIVLQLTVPCVDNAKRLARGLVAEGIPETSIEFVINRQRKGAHNCTPQMVEDELGKNVLELIPNDFQEVSTAIDAGRLLSARSRVRTAIRRLAQQLAGGEDGDAQTPTATTTSWLQKLARRRTKATTPTD